MPTNWTIGDKILCSQSAELAHEHFQLTSVNVLIGYAMKKA